MYLIKNSDENRVFVRKMGENITFTATQLSGNTSRGKAHLTTVVHELTGGGDDILSGYSFSAQHAPS